MARPVRLRFRRRSDAGQSTVELALVLPFVALLLLGMVHVGQLVSDLMMVGAAAREGARAAAVDSDPHAAERAVKATSTLDSRRLRVDTRHRGEPGDPVTVAVTYRAVNHIPLLRWFVDDVHLSGQATMRVER